MSFQKFHYEVSLPLEKEYLRELTVIAGNFLVVIADYPLQFWIFRYICSKN